MAEGDAADSTGEMGAAASGAGAIGAARGVGVASGVGVALGAGVEGVGEAVGVATMAACGVGEEAGSNFFAAAEAASCF